MYKDNHFNLCKIKKLLKYYSEYCKLIQKMNNEFLCSQRKIRQPNFPSEISENIARLVLQKLFKNTIEWDISGGDLRLNNKRIEVKAFSSQGPLSFGAKENWNYICFVDCRNFNQKLFTVYFSRISNISNHWKSISLNKNEKYYQGCSRGIRPRISFNKIKKHLRSHIKIVFNGKLSQLK